MEAIEIEVHKLIECGFIREEQYPNWIANIVPVLKKNGKIRVCINFCDLNTTCPKDEISFPIIDIMIDNTYCFKRMSVMDGFFRVQSYQDVLGMIKSIHHFEHWWGVLLDNELV